MPGRAKHVFAPDVPRVHVVGCQSKEDVDAQA
jgi:hypothetical protein